MKITARQAYVLDNLHRITMRPVGGRPAPFLDGEPCRLQINSLAAKRLIAFDGLGQPVKIRDHDGVFVTRRERARPRASPGTGPAEQDRSSGSC